MFNFPKAVWSGHTKIGISFAGTPELGQHFGEYQILGPRCWTYQNLDQLCWTYYKTIRMDGHMKFWLGIPNLGVSVVLSLWLHNCYSYDFSWGRLLFSPRCQLQQSLHLASRWISSMDGVTREIAKATVFCCRGFLHLHAGVAHTISGFSLSSHAVDFKHTTPSLSKGWGKEILPECGLKPTASRWQV